MRYKNRKDSNKVTGGRYFRWSHQMQIKIFKHFCKFIINSREWNSHIKFMDVIVISLGGGRGICGMVLLWVLKSKMPIINIITVNAVPFEHWSENMAGTIYQLTDLVPLKVENDRLTQGDRLIQCHLIQVWLQYLKRFFFSPCPFCGTSTVIWYVSSLPVTRKPVLLLHP